VALIDALGNLVRFVLLPGQRHDSVGVAPLIQDLDFAALLADKAFNIDWLRAALDERGATAVTRLRPIGHSPYPVTSKCSAGATSSRISSAT
jgi:transposase